MDNSDSTRPTVISRYRSDEEIRTVLQEISARPPARDEPGRLRALMILDDLAEEMIGRGRAADSTLKDQIQSQRVRWTEPV